MRATPDDVRAIIETSLDNSIITSYIVGAHESINAVLLNASLSEALLKQIEVWYTAHLIAATRERQTKREEAGSAKVEYTGNHGMGLDLTSYGQTVKTLDPTGLLANLGKRRASIKAVPSPWQVS